MQAISWGETVRITNEDSDRKVKITSPARQLKLDARRKDAALWLTPQKYPKFSPYMAWVGKIRERNLPPSPRDLNDTWRNMTPEEKLPFVTLLGLQLAQYRSELQDFNPESHCLRWWTRAIPMLAADTSDSETNGIRSFGRRVVCQEKGGYGDCPDHPPSYQQLLNRRVAQLWNRYRRDHPEACGGAVTPVPKQAFRFLDMLPELRTAVYRFCLKKSQALKQMEPDQSSPQGIECGTDEQLGPVDVRILVVCKQIHDEATTVFFSQNTFKIELEGEQFPNLPSPMFRTGYQPTNQDPISKLKKIELDLKPGRKCAWALEHVCKELANRASLQEVRLNAHDSEYEDSNADKAMDEIFEILTVLKGVGKVVFSEGTTVDVWDNVHPARTLGTQVVRDRVSTILTAVS